MLKPCVLSERKQVNTCKDRPGTTWPGMHGTVIVLHRLTGIIVNLVGGQIDIIDLVNQSVDFQMTYS